MKIAEIIWEDAHMDHEYCDISRIKNMKPKRRRNSGYLVSMDDEVVVLASGEIDNEPILYEAIMTIPRSMILETHIVRS